MPATGYFLALSEDRSLRLEEQLDWTGDDFAEAVPEFDHSRNCALLVFVCSEPGFITHIADGRRGVRAGTDQRRLNLAHVHKLKASVSVEELLTKVSPKSRRHLVSRIEEGGLLPPATFNDVVAALSAMNDELSELLRRYGNERRQLIARLSPEARQSLAQQKEALSGALKIADIDRKTLLDWTPASTSTPKSFIEGLEEARLYEDNVIHHDQIEALPGFTEVKRAMTGVARFESEEVVLEVIVANKTPLERQTGADLIYYNATFDSFVLVQYKMMERDSEENEAVFRLPNKQLAEEISRMKEILRTVNQAGRPSHRHHYRLNENPFFIKLVPRLQFDPTNVGLGSGMYFPLGYWRFIETDSDLGGSRGGRIVTFKNVKRYLNNSAFAGIVRAAWIGTTPQQNAILGPIIKNLLEKGRAVVLAVETDKRVEIIDDDRDLMD